MKYIQQLIGIQRTTWVLLSLIFLSACQYSNQLALYSLSQTELNQQLSHSLGLLQQNARLAGIPVHLKVNSLQAQIAQDGQPLIQLQLNTEAQAKMALLQVPLQLALTLSAEPYFDQQRQAIYLRQFRVIQSELTAGRWQGKLKPLNRELEQLLQQLLAQQPVYQLDPNKLSHRALLNIPLTIKLSPGKLVLSPAYL
ncbi:MAG: DUF1439 domain-containing protein [Gammaproteobacteria bacterium]|nr:DUF1439 domain-containing protein [Gammaproteobacteria bacterium]